MAAAEFSLYFFAAALLAFGAFMRFDRRLTLRAGLLFAGYIALDDFVTGLPSALAEFRLIDANWNWSGKLYSLVLAGVVLAALRIRPSAAGITLAQRNLTVCWLALAGFLLWGATLGLVFQPEAASAETLAFQALMPGLSEELAYRGIAPAILLGLYPDRDATRGMPWAVILLTAVVFGVWHGLQVSSDGVGFDLMSASFPFVGSIAGGWLRFSSGSLLFPILGHGIANVAFHLAPLLKP